MLERPMNPSLTTTTRRRNQRVDTQDGDERPGQRTACVLVSIAAETNAAPGTDGFGATNRPGRPRSSPPHPATSPQSGCPRTTSPAPRTCGRRGHTPLTRYTHAPPLTNSDRAQRSDPACTSSTQTPVTLQDASGRHAWPQLTCCTCPNWATHARASSLWLTVRSCSKARSTSATRST